MGSLRPGLAVRLRSLPPRTGAGCGRRFYAVEPHGYVCLDPTTTLKANHPRLRELAESPPGRGVMPFRYALSNGAPLYRRLPTEQEWQKAERHLGKPGTYGKLSWGNRGHERLAEQRPIPPDGPLPPFLAGETPSASSRRLMKKLAPLGTTVAYTRAFRHAGRTWLLTPESLIVPADRVRPFRESTFAGIEMTRGMALPLAWNRGSTAPLYWADSEGHWFEAPERWVQRSAVALDPDVEPSDGGGQRYLATREQNSGGVRLWVRKDHATVVRVRRPPAAVKPNERWIVVSITRGTLVAYQGERAVFATLISPGAGGVPVPGKSLVKMSTTPLGVFRMSFKVRSTTMSPEKGDPQNFWLAEVPYTQYFSMPFALHTAYWHEDFGQPMSAGCINVSPQDGRWLFAWTSPTVPTDWSGAAASKQNGTGTLLVVVR
ncbi:L,D-transpeptidase [Myxococcota bacterium]